MDWDAIGAVGEVVGALAVVSTLIYLAREVRLSRLANEAASVDALAAGWNAVNVHVLADRELRKVFVDGFRDPDTLDADGQMQLTMMSQSYINHFQAVRKRYEAGLLPESEWETQASGISHVFNSPGGRWVLERCAVTPELRAVIDAHRGDEKIDGFAGIRAR